MTDNLLLLNLVLSLFMTGLIWTIQLVHYPAFRYVEIQKFSEFAQFHQKAITPITALPMILEILVAGLLMILLPHALVILNFMLLLLVWAATFFLSVPCHSRLLAGHDYATIEKLIQTNWIRTALWTLRSVQLIGLIYWDVL